MKRPGLTGLLFAGIALLFVIPSSVRYYTDWLWFRELGYEQVFLRTLSARALTGTLTGLAALAFLWLNLRLALRTLRRRDFTISTPEGPRVISVDTSRIRTLALVGAGVASLLIGLYSASHWDTWLYYLNAVQFGRVDPVLQRDIAFYVFSLPLLEHLQGLAFLTVALATAGVLAARWRSSDGAPWSFRGRLAGERLVGSIRYNGVDFPTVLERAPRDRR